MPLSLIHAQELNPERMVQVFKEQRSLNVRRPEQLPAVQVPDVGTPFTILDDAADREGQKISLDEAIQIAIQNADVIRVLTGLTASSSGRTVYDVAIANTNIDLQTAVFDPTFDINSTMNKTDRPAATFDPSDPTRAIFAGSSTDSINTTLALSKRTLDGGTVGLNANTVGSYFEPGVFPLEPEYRSFAEITLRQPFVRGAGRAFNLSPIVVARIDTERSYFQFKDSVQELVRGVIAAYWNLVSSRIEVWAREQQIEQLQFAYDRASQRMKQGLDRVADVAQARSALANFKASLITARSNLILNETALRNILGLKPSNSVVLVPTSNPLVERVDFDWDEIISMAAQYRPDIIELKLILEADRQLVLQADNQAKPQFDGIANYRWDGLSGEMPSGAFLPNDPGRFAGFNLGVNFSVPLGLRSGRASLRRQELNLAQDKLNLEQGIHQMVHQLTLNYRNLDQFFEQYVAFKEAREAARLNFSNQAAVVRAGRREFINVLQAITDWGNAVSQEARSITQYNTELANVERQTGTILETHGVRFVEERFGSIGPEGLLGVKRTQQCYPGRLGLDGGSDKYEEAEDTSDDSFNLKDLEVRRGKRDKPDTSDLNRDMDMDIDAPQPKLEGSIESSDGAAIGSGTRQLNSAPMQQSKRRTRLIDLFR